MGSLGLLACWDGLSDRGDFFFFQAEDGIRDSSVTGVQTCALPIYQILTYGQKAYKNYHGSEEGWSDVLAAAKSNPVPPQGFNITKYVPPTPAQQAHD